MIQKGKKVALEYSVFLEDGTQIDTNIGEAPLHFVHGSHQVFPALESAVIGMKIGDSKKIILSADEAYGPIVEEAFRQVEVDAVPPQFRFVGAILGVQDPAGGVFPIRVHAIDESKVTLDFNHPLAGKTLHFEVKVIGVDP